VPIPAVLHACYRQSRLQSAVVASMLAFHWARKSWQEQVDAYITLTEFARQKFIQNGLPAERLFVKPNFITPVPGERRERADYALFVGYLGQHKGIRTLLEAWRGEPHASCGGLSHVPLKIIGDGPLFNEAKAYIEQYGLTSVELLGRCPREEVFSIMKKAAFLLFPSLWYEGFPMTIVEAFACGVPVIASRLGAMRELIEHQRTGLHFTAHDADDLASKVEWALTHPHEMERMGKEGRQEYENNYTAEQNYRQLLTIYQQAQARHAQKRE
jgi:glycosyltransferase involved in cell wall biosynthesis